MNNLLSCERIQNDIIKKLTTLIENNKIVKTIKIRNTSKEETMYTCRKLDGRSYNEYYTANCLHYYKEDLIKILGNEKVLIYLSELSIKK